MLLLLLILPIITIIIIVIIMIMIISITWCALNMGVKEGESRCLGFCSSKQPSSDQTNSLR